MSWSILAKRSLLALAVLATSASAQQAGGALVLDGPDAYLEVRMDIPDHHAGKPGAIYLLVTDQGGNQAYLTGAGLSEARVPMARGALPWQWRRSLDLRPVLSPLAKGRPYDRLEMADVCAALFGAHARSAGQVILEAAYQVAEDNPGTSGGDDGAAAVTDAFARVAQVARQMGQTDVAERYEQRGRDYATAATQKTSSVTGAGGQIASANTPLNPVYVMNISCQ